VERGRRADIGEVAEYVEESAERAVEISEKQALRRGWRGL
jgi:hypothetical protein